jgi:hypothetical protein
MAHPISNNVYLWGGAVHEKGKGHASIRRDVHESIISY